MAMCLLLAWVIVYFITMRGIQSSGKVRPSVFLPSKESTDAHRLRRDVHSIPLLTKIEFGLALTATNIIRSDFHL